MPTKCYTHLSAEDRETLSLGPGPRPFAAEDGPRVGAIPQHPQPRVGSQLHARPTLSGLHGVEEMGSGLAIEHSEA